MSILKEFKSNQKSTGASNMENVAVRITNYDLDNRLFVGTRLEDNKEVRVRLREDKSSNNRTYKRPEIEDFVKSARQSKVSTEIGGVIQFDGVYADKDGVLSARWPTVLTHDKEEGKVFVRQAQFISGVSANGQEWAAVDVAYPEQVIEVDEIEAFKKELAELLDPRAPVDSRSVSIQVVDGDETAILHAVAVKNAVNDKGYSITSTGKESLDEFMKTDEYKVIEALIENGVSLIPGRRVFAGKATRDKLFSDEFSTKANRLRKQYEVGTNGEGEIIHGFVPSNIVLRSHRDGTLYFTHINPTIDNNTPIAVEQLIA